MKFPFFPALFSAAKISASASDFHPGPFPETPEGQRDFLEAVNDIVLAVPGGHGKGVYWWEPVNAGARGFFDAQGNTLAVFDVFHKYTRPIHRTDGQ